MNEWSMFQRISQYPLKKTGAKPDRSHGLITLIWTWEPIWENKEEAETFFSYTMQPGLKEDDQSKMKTI